MKNERDSLLQQLVIDELDWDPAVDAADIGVSVRDGVVTLNGHVMSFAEKRAAEEAAQRVAGVEAVADEIDVRIPGGARPTDAELAAAVVHAIRWHVSLPDRKLRVKVEDGIVTLEGQVEWRYQIGAAVDAVRAIKGVRGLINLIQIRPSVLPDDLKARIRRALERSAVQDADAIEVEVHGREIRLSGYAHTWRDRDDALKAASAAPGVTSVVNDIKIRPRVVA